MTLEGSSSKSIQPHHGKIGLPIRRPAPLHYFQAFRDTGRIQCGFGYDARSEEFGPPLFFSPPTRFQRCRGTEWNKMPRLPRRRGTPSSFSAAVEQNGTK